MKTMVLNDLFGIDVAVQDNRTAVLPAAMLDALVRGAVGSIVAAPPQSFALETLCGRVAAVRIIPRVVVDPVIPLALFPMDTGHWWAMRRYWKALLMTLNGEIFARRQTRNAIRVVLHTLDDLTVFERVFFEAHLWGAFNGEA